MQFPVGRAPLWLQTLPWFEGGTFHDHLVPWSWECPGLAKISLIGYSVCCYWVRPRNSIQNSLDCLLPPEKAHQQQRLQSRPGDRILHPHTPCLGRPGPPPFQSPREAALGGTGILSEREGPRGATMSRGAWGASSLLSRNHRQVPGASRPLLPCGHHGTRPGPDTGPLPAEEGRCPKA